MWEEKRLALTARKEDLKITFKRLKNWLDKASVPFNAAVDGVWTAISIGLVADVFLKETFKPENSQEVFSFCGGYKPLVQSFILGDRVNVIRNVVIMKGCNEGICFVMKNYLGGKEDVKTNMVAGFGYGVVISLVTGMRGGPDVVSVGVMFALFNGGMFKFKPSEKKKK